MKKLGLLFIPLLAMASLWAADLCVPHEEASIDAEAHCVDTGGIGIDAGEEDAKDACAKDKKVEDQCGPNGELTRVKAYKAWFNKLKHFEDVCSVSGGSFYFKDSQFKEPETEAFCHDPTVEVGSTMFEEPLCNYKSTCPQVDVVCDRPCGT